MRTGSFRIFALIALACIERFLATTRLESSGKGGKVANRVSRVGNILVQPGPTEAICTRVKKYFILTSPQRAE